jgi:hypothetical protein
VDEINRVNLSPQHGASKQPKSYRQDEVRSKQADSKGAFDHGQGMAASQANVGNSSGAYLDEQRHGPNSN